MKSVDRYLYRHSNGVFYFRYMFPAVAIHSPFEVIVSLKTKDIYRANAIILKLRIITNELLDRLNREIMRKKIKKLSSEDLKRVVRDYIKECLKRMRVQIDTGDEYYASLADETPTLSDINWIDGKAYRTPIHFEYDSNAIESLKTHDSDDIRFPDLPDVLDFNKEQNLKLEDPEIHDVIRWLYSKHSLGSNFSQGTTTYKKLMANLIGALEYLDTIQNNEKFGLSPDIPDYEEWKKLANEKFGQVKTVTDKTLQSSKDSPKMSEVLETYLTELERQGKREKSIKEKREMLSFLIEVVGDIEILSVEKQSHAVEFKECLLKLPANRKKKYPNLALEELFSLELDNDAMIKTATINKYLETARAFFNWLIERNNYEEDNPFKGLKVKQTRRQQAESRYPYSSDDLVKIFGSMVYQGCAGDGIHKRLKSGDIILNDSAMFWLPLMALYSGLRRNEMCSLYVKDIYQSEEGIWLYDINENDTGKTVKSDSTERTVPIHKAVINMGFLDYIAKLKKNNQERVFPELGLDGRGGYGDAFGKRYKTFAKKVGVYTPKKTFHSFRHTITDKLNEIECTPKIAYFITGHSDNQGAHGLYGGPKPKTVQIKAWLDKVEYPEINELLKQTKQKIAAQQK
ncbi:MAG: tyrosine-type recombinase/integrase [Alphaproteobacteria bacterium]